MKESQDQAVLVRCKICGAEAPHWADIDWNHNAVMKVGFTHKPLPPAGRLASYYQCAVCGFLFSNCMDSFTSEQFKEQVYNGRAFEELDGGYNGARAGVLANFLYLAIPSLPSLQVLDYGGGLGYLSLLLGKMGVNVHTYDPYALLGDNKPKWKSDLVICQEVLEHSVDPHAIAKDLVDLCKDDGLIFISTEYQPPVPDLSWFYLTPRVGHISFYTPHSLSLLFQGWRLLTVQQPGSNGGMHFVYKTWPGWASALWVE